MKNRDLQRRSLKASLVLHGAAFLLLLIVPWLLKACRAKRPPEKLMFVEFTVSIPPPPAPDVPTPPAPEPPKPAPTDDIKIPDKKPEPPKPPTPPANIRQDRRITRDAPPPKDKPLSPAEIERLLKQGARISDVTSIPTGGQAALGAYFNHVHERMHEAWQQPTQLKNLPGLRTEIAITVEPGGRITARRKTRPSGNDLMDDSVMKAVNAVSALRPLPAGYRDPVEITITFELSD
jgi:colicin import membrane protein